MHSHRRKLIIIIADSWQRDVFLDALESGQLPEIQKDLVEGGCFFKSVVSVFPSVSLSSHASILTGRAPSAHGIPGHRWYDKKGNYSRNYIGLGGLTINGDISHSVSTVFELGARSLSVQSTISRGAADVTRVASLSSAKILRRAVKHIRSFQPDTCVIWLPQGDRLAHSHGPRAAQCLREMQKTSYALGRFIHELPGISGEDKYDLLLLSDHGQRAVHEIYDFRPFFRRYEIPLRINPRRVLSSGCNLFTNGDSSAFLYFSEEIDSKERTQLSRNLVKEQGVGLVFMAVNDTLHYVYSKDGVSCLRGRNGRVTSYEIIEGSDPLRIMSSEIAEPPDFNNIHESIHWHYPDILMQYLSSRVPSRSPDILVTADCTYHFGQVPRIGWRLGFHRGSHGAPSRDEMLTFAIYRGQDIVKGRSEEPIRIWDILARIGQSES